MWTTLAGSTVGEGGGGMHDMRDKYCFLLFFSSRSIFPPFLFFFLLFFSFPLSRPFSIDTQLGFRFFKLKSSSTSSLAIESRYAHFFSLSFILVHSLSLIHSHSLSLSLSLLSVYIHIFVVQWWTMRLKMVGKKKNVVDVERDVAEEKRGEYCW